MARPGRQLNEMGKVVRRRHRTWMASMTLATIGWAVIWISVCVARWAPEWAPDPTISFNAASFFALVGLGLGVFTLRAKLAWILITGAPLFANGSLLTLRYVIPDLLVPVEQSEETARQGAERPAVLRAGSGRSRAA